jgi:hypothetical protein
MAEPEFYRRLSFMNFFIVVYRFLQGAPEDRMNKEFTGRGSIRPI